MAQQFPQFNCHHIKGSKINVLAFYKGTPMCVLAKFNSIEEWYDFKKKLENCIVLGLKNGISLQQQEIDYFHQLDVIENDCNKGITPTERDQHIYCMNIACLLKMKKLNDDNMNGFLVTNSPFK